MKVQRVYYSIGCTLHTICYYFLICSFVLVSSGQSGTLEIQIARALFIVCHTDYDKARKFIPDHLQRKGGHIENGSDALSERHSWKPPT